MGIYDFDVKLNLEETIKMLDLEIIKGTITEKIDCHEIYSECQSKAVIMVYGKRYFRASNRLTLTLCIEQFKNKTHIHVIGIGSVQTTSSDECEISKKFTNLPKRILEKYIIE